MASRDRWYDPEQLIRGAQPRDRVVIRDRFGVCHRGVATLCMGTHVVCNMGGAHGTPGIAEPQNVVSVAGRKSVTEGYAERLDVQA